MRLNRTAWTATLARLRPANRRKEPQPAPAPEPPVIAQRNDDREYASYSLVGW
ncbi:hypothetical protein HPO96_20625 [Kribbella sandramycini]|uniref:Uncharacterized protein n=1 Tax=Kribbella sandramycini TaxID=60450 RepID=A0A7Y4L1K7_9ACTN|nr:hypothetical protein [Kribbella sandramycini]MBB6564959.1 hypothetical protein [Kribbella sandramycini]NOL42655.1 hypothetical protein [Kribbella sandramycini]